MKILPGEVVRINLNPIKDKDQRNYARTCLVLSNDKYNTKREGIVIVTPIIDTLKPKVRDYSAVKRQSLL